MTPTPVPQRWKLLARDAVHWRAPPPCKSPKTAPAHHRLSPPSSPLSPRQPRRPRGAAAHDDTTHAESFRGLPLPNSPSSNSDSSLSSISRTPTPAPTPAPGPAPSCPDFSAAALGLALPTPCSAPPSLPPTAAAGACLLAAEASLLQRRASVDSGQREYLTPSPTPSRDAWDPSDAYVNWDEAAEAPRPAAEIDHMWTSPLHPPELRFLTLKDGDHRIYALPTKLLPHFASLDWIAAVPGRRVVIPAQSLFAVRKRECEQALCRQLQKEGSCEGWGWG